MTTEYSADPDVDEILAEPLEPEPAPVFDDDFEVTDED